jgi:hypothetical protein
MKVIVKRFTGGASILTITVLTVVIRLVCTEHDIVAE